MTLKKYQESIQAEKKQAALKAATHLFLSKGYARTSLQDVAKAAGISSATVFKHFPTKAELFGGVMEYFWENDSEATQRLILPEGSPQKALKLIGQDYARLLTGVQAVPLFRAMIGEVTMFPELGQQLYERGKKPYLERLEAYLGNEVKKHKTLKIQDVPLAVRQFLGMINDIIFWPNMLVVNLKITPKDIEYVVEEATKTFLARYSA
jgi:TetR/AcrR family transcriptional regulator, regulator of autoinduction and epiphytic fitness